MTTPRSQKIDLESTPFYHIMSRCVRRTFLCGIDHESGRDYSHRKANIVSRIKFLSEAFAINIAAYAIMSNHYHLVVHIDEAKAKSWDEKQIKLRWEKIFPNDANQLDNLPPPQAQKKLELWRQRLSDISWFMRCLNEQIAKSSNKEDDCTGRFWEGRFKSQALLDEGAVLAAMAYVDLNPIRAKAAQSLEGSEFTSIQERIQFFAKQLENNCKAKPDNAEQPSQLMPFTNTKKDLPFIDFKFSDYLELVDTTGRMIKENKRGKIANSIQPILFSLQLNPESWIDMVKNIETKFFHGIGSANTLREFTLKNKDCFPRGLSAARDFYKEVA